MMKTEHCQYNIHILNKEVRVFEIGKQSEVNKNREGKQQATIVPFLDLRHPSYQIKINESGSQNYKDKTRRPPAIKYYAKYKYNNVFKFFGNQVIRKYKCR